MTNFICSIELILHTSLNCQTILQCNPIERTYYEPIYLVFKTAYNPTYDKKPLEQVRDKNQSQRHTQHTSKEGTAKTDAVRGKTFRVRVLLEDRGCR